MEKKIINLLKNVRGNIQEILDEDDSILYEFEVAPLDHAIIDTFTPRMTISSKKLIFSYDTTLEIYNLADVQIDISGDTPQFSLIGQLTEGSYTYSKNFPEDFDKMRNNEKLTRMSLNELKKPPRDFLFRRGNAVANSYQTWAMAQLITNVQKHVEDNEDLYEIVAGNFTRFRRRPVILFLVVLLAYFFLRVISQLWLPELISTILDFGFAGVLIAALFWIARSIEDNNRRFKRIFMSYEKDRNSSSEIFSKDTPQQ